MSKDILSKIVFFDEQTAFDYVEIRDKGRYIKETEKSGKASAKAENDISIKSPTLFSFLRLNAEVSASAEVQKIVRSTVSNTILTDFISKADTSSDITRLSGYDIKLTKETKLSIYTAITDASSGNIPFDSSGMGMDISKFGSVLKNLQGYLECSAVKDGEPNVMLRFNSNCFRNNYKLADIISMNLEYYCVKVGSTNTSTLSVLDLELTGATKPKHDNFNAVLNDNRGMDDTILDEDTESRVRDVYDIILAGVFSNESKSD